jgi:hypothetical protein
VVLKSGVIMADVTKNNIKVLGIILIVLSVLGIISTILDFNQFNEMKDLSNKFGIDNSSYVSSHSILIILELLLSVSVLVFSILLINHKKIGRIGLIISLVVAIFYILIAPLIPGDEVFRPQPIPYDNSSENVALLISYIFYVAISVGIIFIIRYLNKKEIKQLFNSPHNQRLNPTAILVRWIYNFWRVVFIRHFVLSVRSN